MVAFSNKPDGDFVKQPKPIFYKKDVKFAAEDPFIWYQNGKYRALLKDNKGEFTHQGLSIALFESADAINWKVSKNALAFKMEIPWTTGTQKVDRLERPQLYFENGVPKILFAAGSVDNKTFNVSIPLKGR
jgi:sucrose-6-phosphate hydrolase SacC (GH32 family)